MATSKKKELLIGVAMLGTGLGYLLMTTQLPRHDGIVIHDQNFTQCTHDFSPVASISFQIDYPYA